MHNLIITFVNFFFLLFLFDSLSLLTHFASTADTSSLASVCKIHQFKCDSGKCIDLDQFCNGNNDCEDSSDEPRHCTPCNRTYYGVKSSTYNLQLHNPQGTKQAFSCSLTFIATSGTHGDLIQIKFNSIFLAKKSAEEEMRNCQNTKLIIQEPDRQIYSEFCHYSFLNKIYFSETNRLILTFVTTELTSSGFNFDFKLSFKFIGKEEAVVRYGQNYFRGELLPGTPCSLLFNNCYRQRCSLQSPNYPGLYPRNVTCYYAIRHHNSPDTVNYHSVINLQTLSLNIQSKQPNNLTFSNSRDFKENCVDTLTVYDGYTIRDPVLVSVCGQGSLENITSSSNELLVEFHTTGVNLFADEIQSSLGHQGFHMMASIRHIHLNSNKYVENHNCVFRTSSLHNKSGYLESPNHSLPSKTHCVYQIQGSSHELIWLQVLYYHVQSEDCNNTYLSIYDEPYESLYEDRMVPLVRICNNQTETLKSCEFRLNRNNSRPCTPSSESYISSSNQMTLIARTESGTLLDHLEFRIYYEFIDVKQDGLEIHKPCGRIITQTGHFHSPKNTFLYGRGGRRNIRCFYQFLPGTILLDFFLMSSPTCSTIFNEKTRRYECSLSSKMGGKKKDREEQGKSSHKGVMTGQIKYYKSFSNETRIQHGCFCTNINNTIRFSSKFAQQIEIVVQNMEHWADASHFYFNGSYTKERPGLEQEELTEVRTYTSLSGLIHLTNGSVVIVQPPSNYYYAYVFNSDPTQRIDCGQSLLLVHNMYTTSNNFHDDDIQNNNLVECSHQQCSMRSSHYRKNGNNNNYLLTNASNILQLCPDHQVNIYSPNYDRIRDTDNKLVLELVSSQGVKLNYVMIQKQSESVCQFYCASIDGCLPSQVLCNGLSDCPDSSDEVGCQFNYNYEYLIVVFVIILIILLALFIYHNCARRPLKETGVS